MPRPTKCRRVCYFPEILEFSPAGEAHGEPITLTVDEFETIRLIDKEGLSQEECGAQLGVGRTTAQKIYETARKKLADALVCGCSLKIEGGDFRLCSDSADVCYKKDCIRRQIQKKYKIEKGANTMRIAVTYENGNVFQHFGHTGQFKLYDIQDGRVIKSELIDTNGSGHGALAGILSAVKADVLICGGIGGGAQMALAEHGIKLYGGVSGSADEAVNAFLSGNLAFNPDVHCEHHNHEHGGEAHACGSHGCGHGHCGHR
ncbi:MAG: DNA-binding protein [Clostridiales bacterium]|jgi:predicted DNA-binding proteins|nr:MAG: DNA-binding protein [Clostridiales bacterium]